MKSKSKKNEVRKPVQQRGQAKVAAVLSATETLIQRHGYAAVKMGDIADEANVSIASIYQYFPNKQAILETLVSNHMRSLQDYVFSKLKEAPQDIDALWLVTLKLFDDSLEFHRNNPVFRDVMAGSAAVKTMQAIMQEDSEINLENFFQVSHHLFDSKHHAKVKQALFLMIDFGKEGVIGAVEIEEKAAKERVKVTKELMSACWENVIKPLAKTD